MLSRLSVGLGLSMIGALAFAQPFSISGKVTTAGGAGMSGVTVGASGLATYTGTSSPGLPILDHGVVTDTINIVGAGNIVSILVDVNITHTFRGDLILTLFHPDATAVILHNRTGGSADNIIGQYPTNLTPAQPLSLLFGKPAAGAYNLRVEDRAAGDTGRLNSWGLTITAAGGMTTGVTNALGNYTIAGLAAGTYAVAPTTGAFIPASRSVTVGPNATNIDFVRDEGAVSGTIRDRGMPVGGVLVEAALLDAFSRSPGLPITDNATTTDSLTVPTAGTISGMSVGINITHTWIGDLMVTVFHPDATAVILHNRTGGSADNIVTTYPSPTTPAQSLGAFDGKPRDGSWNLSVNDNAAGDIGTLNSWTLIFGGSPVGTTATLPDGTYAFNGLGAGVPIMVRPSHGAYVFSPPFRTATTSVSGQDFDFAVPLVQSVSAPDTLMSGTDSQNGTITLTSPVGPAGPITVALTSTDPSVTVPANASVSSGQSSGTFAVTSTPVTNPTYVLLTAVAGGFGQIISVINIPSGQTAFFGGEFDFRNGLASEQGTLVPIARTYDDFTVSQDTTLTAVVGQMQRRSPAPVPTQARVQIRSGIFPGNEGTAIFDQIVPVTSYGVSALFVFGSSIDALSAAVNVPLTAGTYHVSISPIGNGTGRFFVATTSGLRGVGSPLANGNAFLSFTSGTTNLVAEPVDSATVFGPGIWDFAYGVVFEAAAARTATGTVTFGSLDGSATPPATVTIQFRTPNTTNVVSTEVVSVNPITGEYTANAPAAGVYDLAVFETNYGGWTWLRSIREDVDFTAGNQTGVNFDLINGDVNNDNRVDIDDFLIMAGTYEVSPPTAPEADITRNGAVDIDDFLVLASSYELIGPD